MRGDEVTLRCGDRFRKMSTSAVSERPSRPNNCRTRHESRPLDARTACVAIRPTIPRTRPAPPVARRRPIRLSSPKSIRFPAVLFAASTLALGASCTKEPRRRPPKGPATVDMPPGPWKKDQEKRPDPLPLAELDLPVRLPTFDEPGPGPGKTPRETFEAVQACVRRGDYVSAWDLFSSRAVPFMCSDAQATLGMWRHFRHDAFVRIFGMTPEEFERRSEREMWAHFKCFEHLTDPGWVKGFSEAEYLREKPHRKHPGQVFVIYRTGEGERAVEHRMQLMPEKGVWTINQPYFEAGRQ